MKNTDRENEALYIWYFRHAFLRAMKKRIRRIILSAVEHGGGDFRPRQWIGINRSMGDTKQLNSSWALQTFHLEC